MSEVELNASANTSKSEEKKKATKITKEVAAKLEGESSKPSLLERYANSELIINDRDMWAALCGGGRKFPYRFHKQRLPGGESRLLIEKEGQVLEFSSITFVTDSFGVFVRDLGDKHKAHLYGPSQLQGFIKHWHTRLDCLEEPIALVRQKSEPGYCWHRLDFDAADVPTPTFDMLHSKIMCNRDALLGWFGALFHPDVTLQQYVWLYGDGQNGKGSLFRFVQKLIGQAYCTLETDEKKINQFTVSGLVGKALAVDADCDHPRFVTSGFFKQLTGGDSMRIEEKNRPAYSERLFCQVAFGSNTKPKISSSNADLRRAIFVEFMPIPEDQKIDQFEEKLWEERAGILWKMLRAYDDLKMPGRAEIRIEKGAQEELANETEYAFEDFFEANLIEEPDAFLPLGDIHNRFAALEIEKGCNAWAANQKWDDFKSWLMRKGFRSSRPRENNPKRKVGFTNLVLRDQGGRPF